MAGHEGDVVAQREQLLADTGDQLGVVAPGEIGAADGALEQHVAHPGDFLRFVDEYDMAGRVPLDSG